MTTAQSIPATLLQGDPQPKSQPIGRDNSIPVPKATGNTSFVLKKVGETLFEDRERKPLREGEVEINVRQTGESAPGFVSCDSASAADAKTCLRYPGD